MIRKSHYFLELQIRPWPIISTLISGNLFFRIYLLFKYNENYNLIISLIIIILTSHKWWKNYRIEYNILGIGNFNSEKTIKKAFILFIFSEILLFFSFFWAYFHFYSSPVIELGLTWPPYSLIIFNFTNVPLINTLILLTSGITITLSHLYLNIGQTKKIKNFLIITITLGVLFRIFQLIEYKRSFFNIRDCNFGSRFFILTGFHGIHVLIGTIFLFYNFNQLIKTCTEKKNYIRLDLSAWYWHFVDVVWIFLYFLVYYLN